MISRLLNVCIFVLFTLGLMPSATFAQTEAGIPAAMDETKNSIQFLAGSQVVLFQTGTMTLAAADHALRVTFEGAAPVEPQETLPSANKEFSKVTYSSLWPGIDLTYEQAEGRPKSSYILAPGADPAAIRLRYNRPVEIQPDGALAFSFETGLLTESAPLAWQITSTDRRAVDVRFEMRPDGSLGFALGEYDPDMPLVIDPEYQWHTYYGGYDLTEPAAALYRADGKLLVVGTRYEPRFGTKNIFAILYDADGNWLKEATFGDLNYDDFATGLAERNNHAFITGYSYGSFVVGSREPVNPFNGLTDIVVLYLDPDLSCTWHTFHGSPDYDFGRGIAISSNWDVYVTGESYSSWMAGNTLALHAYNGGSDLVAIKLNQYGLYQWHTFYGSQADELAGGASLELDTYLWLSGSSPAPWNGPAAIPPLRAHAGGYDITALVLNVDGSYILHGFYGSSGADYGKSVAVDSQGFAYLTGYSNATWGAPKHAHSGGYDITVVKLDDNGTFYWNTFYGSPGDDYGYAVQVDKTNNPSSVYLAGVSPQSWTGPAGEVPVNEHAGGTDMFAMVLTSAGNYTAHTFHGSSEDESTATLAFLAGGSLALAGSSLVDWDGPAEQEALSAFHGVKSAVVIALNPGLAYNWHTFVEFNFQNILNNGAEAVKVLGDGSVLVAGYTTYEFLGPLGEPPLHKNNSVGSDMFLMKLGTNGEYLWHTFYGSVREFDIIRDIAVDRSGNILLVGNSEANWNGPTGQLPKHGFSGTDGNIVILKLNNSGGYLWHTFYGPATNGATGYGIDLDTTGDIYVVGSSENTWNGPAGQLPLHAITGQRDIFVLKLGRNSDYIWHTFYGGVQVNDGFAIDVSGSTLVVAGASSNGWDGPSHSHPICAHSGSENEGVILKLNLNGLYLWHTFHGNNSVFSNVYVDGDENINAGGYSFDFWKGPSNQRPTHEPGAVDFDAIAHLLKLNAAGVYQWHAFFGGMNGSNFMSIDGGPGGVLYMTGSSESSWNGNGSVPPVRPYSGAGTDLMVTSVSSAGSYLWHTFYPASNGFDLNYDAAAQRVVVVGRSNALWFGDDGQEPLHTFANGQDILALSLLDAGLVPDEYSIFLPLIRR